MKRTLHLIAAILFLSCASSGARADPSGILHELSSTNGKLAVTLEAKPGRMRIGGGDIETLSYNDDYAGPVLRVRPGDVLQIHLINHLSQPTNLHFHGIKTSPLFNGDNVHVRVPPGESFDYSIQIPRSQPPGLYWYHSHVHGISRQQVMGGLSGALVVEGLAAQFLELVGVKERIFVLKDIIFDDDIGNTLIDDDMHGVVQSINGSRDLAATMRPGETQLWRFSNQSADRVFHIALPGHQFRVIAEDGSASTGLRVTDVLDIKPASRVEVLVDGGPPGRYDLVSTGTPTGTGAAMTDRRVLGHVSVEGETVTPIGPLSAFPAVRDLREAAIDEVRTIVFSQTQSFTPARQKFLINGRVLDSERVDIRVALGNIEEWTVRNESDDMHVFHIHQVGFQVVAINGVPAAFAGHVDTVRVPERGSVTLRLAFTDPVIVGRFMFHCHVLLHEDKGMMAQIEVYDPSGANMFARLKPLLVSVWWWLHGVPWAYCGSGSA